MRIGFALVTTQLLEVTGLLLAGGVLLLWVCWKMWRELSTSHVAETAAAEALANADLNADGTIAGGAPKKTFAQAATQIVIADVSMSLDNVLAVAGAAHGHPTVLIVGLVLSIALMGLAASFIANLLNKYRWIAYVGLLIILYVALKMMWEGWHEVEPLVMGALG
jgi:YjbE family integral membrane protein